MPNDRAPGSLPSSYFDDVYRANPDPWNFTASPYELAKYQATLAALPHPRYEQAFEVGCSIGVLTAQLAPRCAHLLAIDVSESALDQARARCAAFPQVRFEQRQLPREFPEEKFDLILISEVGYYLVLPDLLHLRARCLAALPSGGHLLLVHWTPFVHDYPLTGDEVHDTFLQSVTASGPLKHLLGQRQDRYRLDLFEKF